MFDQRHSLCDRLIDVLTQGARLFQLCLSSLNQVGTVQVDIHQGLVYSILNIIVLAVD